MKTHEIFMIKSTEDYIEFLKQDAVSLKKNNLSRLDKLKELLYPDPIWKFQRLLRKTEYYNNTSKNIITKIYSLWLKYKFAKLSLKLGFSIPINVFDKGLAIVHYGTIIVNPNARVGKNCRLHACTNIGASMGSQKAPKIGDNVYIAPGVKLYGNIFISNNVAISANAVVNKSVDESDVMVAGIPARTIKKININEIIKNANQ